MVEIGAGHGDLTRVLAESAGRVCSVELDRTFKEHLDPLAQQYKNLEIIYGDFLSTPLAPFKGKGTIKVVGNIPYGITGRILSKLVAERSGIESIHLTVQKEIGQRMAAKPFTKAYGALSVICQLIADVKLLLTLRAGVFLPPPKVDSVFVALLPKEGNSDITDEMLHFVHMCFEHKRKHLRYSLVKHFGQARTAELYHIMGFAQTIRAEEIKPERFPAMYRFIENSTIPNEKEQAGQVPSAGSGRN